MNVHILSNCYTIRRRLYAEMSKNCREFEIVAGLCDDHHIVSLVPHVMIRAVGQQGHILCLHNRDNNRSIDLLEL
jgi:hypothetical protein